MIRPSFNPDHILNLSDSTGILQHALYSIPNWGHGYCIDDNARALILTLLWRDLGESFPELNRMERSYTAFLSYAFNPDNGRFRNFMGFDRRWLEASGSEDSHGRALWALGVGAGRAKNDGHRLLCAQLFMQGLPAVTRFLSPRAWAFSLLGIQEYLRHYSDDKTVKKARGLLAHKLVNLWKNYATTDWPWFEVSVTYENARLCQALIQSGSSIPDKEALEIGLQSLTWLAAQQISPAGNFRPIGSSGFYVKGSTRAKFDQQPVEAQAMVSACLTAFQATNESQWAEEANRAFEWFLGRNDLGLSLYDSKSGGCSDGLHPDRINKNQGAESTLAFQLALTEMNCAEHLVTQSLHS